jgi:hypothetical protein
LRTLNLSPTDEATLVDVAKQFLAKSPSTVQEVLEVAVHRWRVLAREVAAGYQYTVDDYINDLSQRELISLLLARGPALLREAVREVVDPIDAEFKSHTVEADHENMINFRQPEMWWYDRLPSKIVTEDF